MSQPYIFSRGDVEVRTLNVAIRDASIGVPCEKVCFNPPNEVIVVMSSGLTTAQLAVLQGVVNAHSNLESLKDSRRAGIDKRTGELIANGFTFDSVIFSLSLPAQKNWMALKVFQSVITWPKPVSTKDNGEYLLTEANLDTFVGTGLAVVEAHINSGRALMLQVNAATDKDALASIEDGR